MNFPSLFNYFRRFPALFLALLCCAFALRAQVAQPRPATQQPAKRVTRVKIARPLGAAPAVTPTPAPTPDPAAIALEAERQRQAEAQKEAARKESQARETQKAVAEADTRAREEFNRREAALREQMEAENRRLAQELEAAKQKGATEAQELDEAKRKAATTAGELDAARKKADEDLVTLRQEAEAEKKRLAEKAEAEKQGLTEQAEARQKELAAQLEAQKQQAAELAAQKKKADEEAEAERQRQAGLIAAEKERQATLIQAEKERQAQELEAANKKATDEAEAHRLAKDAAAEKERQLEEERLNKEKAQLEANLAAQKATEAETLRLETERRAAELAAAELAAKQQLRAELIASVAQRLKFLNLAGAAALVPDTAFTAEEVENALRKALAANPRLVTRPAFCDTEFEGEPLNVMLSANPTLGGLLSELSSLFNVNFLPDPEVLNLPVAGDVKDVPWNFVLRAQLNYHDLEARCANNAVAILKRAKLQTLQDTQRKSAPLRTEFIKLKYLQPVVGGTINVAGRGSASASSLESLETAINRILRSDGDTRGSISRIPGKNEFIITATEEQLGQIRAVIARADRPSYQVIVYASVVTANEQKLSDVGGQLSAIGGTADLGLLGGLTGFPNATTGGGSAGATNPAGRPVPGGVRGLGPGFGNAPSGGSTFGLSNLFGTLQLSAQLSFLQQQGVVKIDNRPSLIVVDGQNADLQIGRQVSIPIQSVNNFGNSPGQLEVLNAGNTLNVTPQVIEDEKGLPVAVNLNLRIESNDVDTTVVSQGVPSIIRRSTQTSLMLNTTQTAVIGGFSTDSETNSQSKTPGLGDVPLFGGLFRRKIKQKNSDRLYFAIRVEVVSQGQVLTVLPMQIDTTPRLPNPGNDFFRPYNQAPPPVKPATPNPDKPE